jgi:SAM-dependent methyltransferase
MNATSLLDVSNLSDAEIQRRWEEAYVRFETPDEEIDKFTKRLRGLGESEWKREAKIVEIFCGRGNGLKALEGLGFTSLEGVDISGALLSRYDGPAKMFEADCRRLPFENESKDIIIVQGGLHHLPKLPADLDETFGEIRRVLRPEGKFVMVEPWSSPFLHLVHFVSDIYLMRMISTRLDAFATMTHYESTTYFNWLTCPSMISGLLQKNFKEDFRSLKWGKIHFVGIPIK